MNIPFKPSFNKSEYFKFQPHLSMHHPDISLRTMFTKDRTLREKPEFFDAKKIDIEASIFSIFWHFLKSIYKNFNDLRFL